MAQSEVIREFLVKLGYQNDEAGLRKFGEGIGRATKAVVTLSTAVAAMAVGVVAGVDKLAKGMEGLYFSAQRTGSTASGIRALQMGLANFGATAEDVQGSLEGMATAIRENPGLKAVMGGLLGQVGEQVSTDQGKNLENLGKLFASLQQRFGAYGTAQAEQYAKMFGISERTMLAVMAPGAGAEVAKQLRGIGGTGGWFDKATKDAHRFEEQMRTLTSVLEGLGAQVFDVLEQRLGGSLATLAEWLQKNGPRLATEISTDLKEFIGWIDKLVVKIGGWVSEYEKLDAKTGGLLTKIGLLALAFTALGGPALLSAIISLGTALGGVLGAFGPVGLAIAGIAAAVYKLIEGLKWLDEHHPNNVIARTEEAFKRTAAQYKKDEAPNPENLPGSLPWVGKSSVGQWFGRQIGLLVEGLVGAVSAQQGNAANATGSFPWVGKNLSDWFTGTGAFNPMLANMQPVTGAPLQPVGATTITNNNTFNIAGADPKKTADAVVNAMRNMARNAAAAAK